MKILGAPFGSAEYMQEFFDNILTEEAKLLEIIPKLPSLQDSWLLLYFCAAPRINHLLRTVPPKLVQPVAQAHDQRILHTFSKVFALPTTAEWDDIFHGVTLDMVMSQAQLPVRMSGLGLRSNVRLSTAAYWAS